MSRQIYSYGSAYDGGATSSLFSLRAASNAAANPYLTDGGSSRHASADPLAAADSVIYSYDSLADRIASRYSKPADPFRYAAADTTGSYSAARIGLGIPTPAASAVASADAGLAGARRSIEALYHQSFLGSHSTVGQSDTFYSSNTMVKRPRLESYLPIYPQRPGEKDCAYYMMTRTCKFGDACKFDHPVWVPEGGIPDWKEVPLIPSEELLPERPGETDCPYYLKTGRCKFAARCKFNHPKDKYNASAGEIGGEGTEISDDSALPDRPSEPLCSFYVKTGKCKFGANCKFHHPKDIQPPFNGQDASNAENTDAPVDVITADGDSNSVKTYVQFTPALLHNSKGLPIRPGETDCPFYMKTGSCKYGPTCRYNHPDRYAINPPLVAAVGQTIMPPVATNLPLGVLNPTANLLQHIDLQYSHPSVGIAPTVYPQRPGEIECDYYMKTGLCKFAERCKFHHPIDRTAAASDPIQVPQSVKLTLAGLPRREGATICAFYMKTGTCKFGVSCKFDHPPPGEAVALATLQGSGIGAANAEGEESKDAGGADE